MHSLSKKTGTFIKGTLGIILLSGTVTGCSNLELIEESRAERSPIMLQSVIVEPKTRVQDTQIALDGRVGFFVTKADGTVEYNNVEIVADNTGNFTYAQQMYYPEDNSTVNFYAVHPYTAGITLGATETWTDFSIKPNQHDVVNYLKSDLLYASKSNISRTKSKVALTFSHKLSKINFTIKSGNHIDMRELTGIGVINVKPSTQIDINTGAIKEASGTPIEVISAPSTPAATANSNVTGIETIIIPQTIAAGSKLFKVTIDGVNYYYTNPDAVAFEGGNCYNYVLTINQTGIEVSSTITDWTNNEPISGEGVSED